MPGLAPRRRLLVAVALLALALPAAAESPAPRRYSIEQFLATTNYRGASFSPDGAKLLVSSDQSGVFNAYAIPVAGGEPLQLTSSAGDSILVQSYFPRDERFLYLADQGGNELDHLYVREPDGSVIDLTPGEKLKALFLDWAADERSFFLATNQRDARYFDVYQVATEGYQRTLVFENEAGLDIGAISPDTRQLALVKTRTTNDNDLYLWDRERAALTLLTAHQGDVAHAVQSFGADGKSLYYTTDEGSEFAYLVRRDLASGAVTVVEKDEWDVLYAHFSRDWRWLVVAVNRDARTEIRLFEAATGKRVALPEVPGAEVAAVTIANDGRRMAFYASASRIPRDLFVADLPGGAPRQLTRSLSPAINAADLVDAEVVRFPSYDGVVVPGLLYRPRGASPQQRVPALVWVHGGPGGQSRVGYSALIQYLVNHGYALYAINNRGSSGYGKSFYRMDDRRHGEADLDDCVASKTLLIETGWVDPQRIGILGGSYGGYMTLAALTFRPREFAVGVDIFGISNWVRTLESIPPWWESFRQALYAELGDPAADGERLRRISPLFHAARIQRPLMVLQGANDPRVLKAESDDIVAAARRNGVPVEYLVFDDEGHGFEKKENQLRGYRAVREFLDRHLRGGG